MKFSSLFLSELSMCMIVRTLNESKLCRTFSFPRYSKTQPSLRFRVRLNTIVFKIVYLKKIDTRYVNMLITHKQLSPENTLQDPLNAAQMGSLTPLQPCPRLPSRNYTKSALFYYTRVYRHAHHQRAIITCSYLINRAYPAYITSPLPRPVT